VVPGQVAIKELSGTFGHQALQPGALDEEFETGLDFHLPTGEQHEDEVRVRVEAEEGAEEVGLHGQFFGRIEADQPGDEEVQDVIERIREDFEGRPLTASLKALVALLSGEDGWRRVRPPLTPVEPADAVTLRRAIEGTGYRLPEFA